MSTIRIASRYAKSLIELAQDQGNLERVYEDVLNFQKATEVKDLYLLLKSPIVNAEKKKGVFNALFAERYDKLTNSFLHIILRKGREMFLPEIAEEFVRQYKGLKKISTVHLTTASKLSEDQLAIFKEKIRSSDLTLDNVDLITKVDPDILGGFVISIEDNMYDASVAYKLEQMRKALAS